jgi:hypothetical protein
MKDSERLTNPEAVDQLRSKLRLKASDLAGAWPAASAREEGRSTTGLHRLRKTRLEAAIERGFACDESSRLVAWSASHLSAFAARTARRSGELASKKVIVRTFRGLACALTAMKHRDGRLTFDAIWPIIEALEELAAVICSSAALRVAFAECYGRLVADQRDPVVTCGLTWGINELLERGSDSCRLARRVTQQVLAADCSDASNALLLFMSKLRPRTDWLVRNVQFSPAGTIIVSDFLQLARSASEEISRILAGRAGNPRSLSQIIESFDHSSAISGILAMASLKIAFRTACTRSIATKNAETGLRRLFDTIVAKATLPNGSVFLAIEAIEAIRDKFPRWCAEAMAERVTGAAPALRIGLFVCLAEGYEEIHAGRLQRRIPRFIATQPGVRFQACTPKTADLDFFGQRIAELSNAGVLLADETEWANKRWTLLERGAV